jgi:phage tail sheath protein FI
MALSNGFPPSNLISPSVRIAETDLSFIAPVQTGHRAGLVGFASKGPINLPTMVTTSRQLHTIYGQPHPDVGDPYLLYASDQYLLFGSELFVVRVGATSPVDSEAASTASQTVLTAGGPVQIIGNIPVGSGWSFSSNQFFRWRLNGILSSNVLVILSNSNRPSPFAGLPYAAQDLVNELNAQLNPSIDGIQFFLSGSGSAALLGVQSTFSYGTSATIELVSVTTSMYGPGSVVGMGTLMTPAAQTGTATQYPPTSVPTPGVFNFSGFSSGTLNLEIVIDGTDNVLIDNVVQTVSISSTSQTITQIVNSINAQITAGTIPGGFTASKTGNSLTLTTNHVGLDAKMLVKAASTAETLFGLSTDTQSGNSPSCVTAPGATYTCGIVSGSANSGGTVCFTITADSPGIDGNNTQVIVTDDVATGSFTMDVYSYGNQVETWAPLVKDPTSFYYVETFISNVSNFIRVTDNTATLALPQASTVAAPYSLSGGSDGIPADPDDQDTLLIGNSTSMTGLQALSDPEQVDIDIVAIPGHSSTTVVTELLSFCQNTRSDCFAIIDSPFGLIVQEIINWQNGVHPLNDVRFDSNFGALYWPWLQYRDTFNHINVWVPPSGSVMAVYANSDDLGGPWEAPAGLNRGLVPNILDVFTRPSLADRDSMYGNQNCINPVVQFADVSGFYVWGQKTLQRSPTALDRVNVRRMMLYIEKQIRTNARSLLFEPNDQKLRNQFIQIASATLKFVQSQRGLTAFVVQCDDILNTPDVIDRNELRAEIGVQPTRAAEFIFIRFTINRTGSFAEADTNTF